MRLLAYGGLLVASALVHVAWLSRLEISGAILDPLLPIAVAVGILRGASSGAVVGTAGGLLQDLLSGGPLGVNGFAKLVVGFASGLFERSIYIENPLLPAVATFAGTLLGEVLLAVVGQVTGFGREPLSGVLGRAGVQAALNSAVAPFLFRVVRRIEVRLEEPR
ncbi:MAG: rod shape-determining protein MreD [Armatimonadota bacterium]|nr:rod shape-determining protein MreD [Armatimonadota bacterium]MDR7466934.1 rod shape-determining protein MreD [Armatimonadota bacterium]MDR7493524.1 rod shape-determining protein MreD [Armatimonadota bacterium]MDR7498789.1 rod shape-determining protein MreD [Armatimonadota bacterium]MDR7503821.1 rod shape-determining protein MreD [Armatimonadota bacterium]